MIGTARAEAPRRVAVVGGGITGLLAAVGLADAGAEVTVVERSATVGGQIHSAEVHGMTVDLGAESLLPAVPGTRELLQRVGLEDAIVDARPGPTLLARGRHLRRLPDGMGPAGPSRLLPVLISRILYPGGLLRAACEPLVPRSHHGADVAVGSYLTSRFGAQRIDRLGDPLLGNLHAGDAHRLGLAAATHRSTVRRAATGRWSSVAGGNPRNRRRDS